MTTVGELQERTRGGSRPKFRIGAVATLALAAGAAVWVLVGRSDVPSPTRSPAASSDAATSSAEPRMVWRVELAGVAAGGTPLYWVGPSRGSAYELTQTPEGRSFVRYLPSAAELGSSRADFLTVATYIQPNAYAAIRAATRRAGAVTIRPAGGGLAVYDRARPTSIFLAFPSVDRQIEVYHPSAAEARRLVRTGAVTGVPALGMPRVVSSTQLGMVAMERPSATYWAGVRRGTVLELTETSEGSAFVRYLPSAAELGSRAPNYLVVGSYPRPRAMADIRTAGRRPGAVRLELRGGGLAVYDRAHPTSVYLAYPGSGNQIEVYHPDARQARALVRSGAIVPVR